MKQKINPLEQLIELYGSKFADALKAGDLTKAIRMCADYQTPDTGKQLHYVERLKAFALRVSFEACKVPEIPLNAITIEFTPEQFLPLYENLEISRQMMFDQDFYRTGTFRLYGINMKKVYPK